MSGRQEHSVRHWYLVSYDIRDDKRWRAAYKLLRGHGERVQYSLFRVCLNRTEVESLRWQLERILAAEDDLLVIHLCPRCAGQVEVRNSAESWDQPAVRFAIL
jgi:CRISPR-associated protein Cas2